MLKYREDREEKTIEAYVIVTGKCARKLF